MASAFFLSFNLSRERRISLILRGPRESEKTMGNRLQSAAMLWILYDIYCLMLLKRVFEAFGRCNSFFQPLSLLPGLRNCLKIMRLPFRSNHFRLHAEGFGAKLRKLTRSWADIATDSVLP
jgi:hypothetical protein